MLVKKVRGDFCTNSAATASVLWPQPLKSNLERGTGDGRILGICCQLLRS
jgi:hypothetical protein